MKVSVEISKGNPFDIQVQPTDTVLNVKKQIEQIQGAQTYPSELQELKYQGKVLKDETTIEENKVSENTFLVLLKMLTYHDILRLEPQNPRTETFSLSDLVWSKVKDRNIDNVAVIPHDRVKDFVKGECSRGGCKFNISSSKKRKEGVVPYKRRVDAVLESKVYQCLYGPDDQREGGETRNSRKCKKPSERKCRGRGSKKIGCQCEFTVKQRCARPTVAIIIYNHQKHVTKSGSTCHGLPVWDCKKRRTERGGELKG